MKLNDKSLRGEESECVRGHRIVVFTGDFSHSVRKGIHAIDRCIPDLEWLVVIHSPPKRLSQLLRNQWVNLKKNGWRWIPYQFAEVVERIGTRIRRTRSVGTSAGAREALSIAIDGRMNTRTVTDIHGEESLAAIYAFKPSLGLSLAAPILRRSVFSIPKLGTLNLHKGKVPEYRGMPPAFWELWNGEQSVGCTVHWVEEKLDTGDVVMRTEINREKYSTVRGLQLSLNTVGIVLMRDAVKSVLHGAPQAFKQGNGGQTYRKPSLGQIEELRTRLMQNQTPINPLMTRLIKSGASTLIGWLWTAGLFKIATPRVTVLLYHRVSDEVRDNLTVGIEQFDRQMALLKKHCTVLSLQEVLALRSIPQSKRPIVCVTFDDGYLDNYVNAAPILLRHGVPAAFFVSTGLIGTNRTFPHDVRRGNPPIPMMSWNHLREMRVEGFTIGSHTVNHIDCAGEPENVVRGELVQSMEDLRRELGIKEVVLGYPYGGRHHMTKDRLELVKQAGYAGCLSAYGGSNIGSVDPYNVLRRGIHWEFSDRAFLLECLGLR